MTMAKFQRWNIIGAVLWVVTFVWGGYFFGTVEFDLFGHPIAIRDHLSTIALVGFGAAFLPVIFGITWRLLASRQTKRAKDEDAMVENR